MKITKYPQSAILIEDYKGKRILIDPGSYCYEDNFTPKDWGKIDILLLTHTHPDHFVPEAISIIKKNNSNLIIISNKEVQEELRKNELDCDILEVGKEMIISGVKIKGIKQTHGLPPNGLRPDVIGFLIDDKLYHPGDTIYVKNKPYADVIFVPICGVVVMNAQEAAKFSKEINPKVIIPIHYDNPKFPIDVGEFVRELVGHNVKVLKNGESLEID